MLAAACSELRGRVLARILLALATLGLCGAEERQPAPLWPYSEAVTKAFVTLTQATYCDEAEDRRRLLQWDCPECAAAGFRIDPETTRFVQVAEIWEPNSTFALLSRIKLLPGAQPTFGVGEGCLVAVRGSETLTNWLRDLEAWTVPVKFDWCEGCWVEDGFFTVTQNLMARLIAGLRELRCVPEGDPLLAADPNATSFLSLTGHSLGAAVSTVAMPLLQEHGFNVRLSHIFESPRVGNSVFSNVFQQEFTRKIPVWRVTYNEDPIPHLPPRFIGYEHVDYEVHYDAEGNYTICSEREDPRGANKYALIDAALHGSDHCTNPLATKRSICWCPWVTPHLDESPHLESPTRSEILV